MLHTDQTKLIRPAAERETVLFPVLNRADALGPLVVLLALIPGLYAVQYHSLDDVDALWGMRAVQIRAASSPWQFIDPASLDAQSALKWTPPLASWLTAASMSMIGTLRAAGLLAVSYLSLAGLVGMVYLFCREQAGSRIAFWTAFLTACHGPLLQQAQHPAAFSLAALFAVTAFWGFLTHLQFSKGLLSIRLLLGGIALGLCTLSGGPLSLLVLVVLFLSILGMRPKAADSKQKSATVHRPVRGKSAAFRSWIVLALTGFAVGGWWPLMMYGRYGGDFVHAWLLGAPHFVSDTGAATGTIESGFFLHALRRLSDPLGGLLGLSLLGLWQAGVEMIRGADETRRRWLQLLVLWTGCAIAVRTISLYGVGPSSNGTDLWPVFALLPLVVLAAFAVDEIVQRRIRFSVAVAVGCLTAAFFALCPFASAFAAAIAGFSWWYVAVIVTLCAAGWLWLRGSVFDQDCKRRLVLVIVVAAQLAVNFQWSFQSLKRADADDRVLSLFRQQLAAIPDIGRSVLLTSQPPPPRIEYALKSIWPAAHFAIVESWDQALDEVSPDPPLQQRSRAALVEWGPRESRPLSFKQRGMQIEQTLPPRYLQGRQLRAYVVEIEPSP